MILGDLKDVSWHIPVIVELVKIVFPSTCTPYSWSDDLEDVRSIETWMVAIWELVAALVFLLTCRLLFTSYPFLATSQRFNVV